MSLILQSYIQAFIATKQLRPHHSEIFNSVIRVSATCSSGITMICAFSTKGISDNAGSASLRKRSCIALVLFCHPPEVYMPCAMLSMSFGRRLG
jgi:hypothetical protein